MGKFVNRRDFLKFLGGGVVGTTLSPLPWKLLDDAAIWTQNWSWLPRLPRGEISVHYTHCTLCPAGCGLRVRCVGDEAFGLSGVRGHPISCGHLCPLGLAGHHLRYHPARLTSPQMRAGKGGPAALSRNEAVTQIAAWLAEARATGGEGAVAVLDARPGRELSLLYRRFLAALGCGAYLVGPSQEASTTVLGEMLTEPYGPLGIDLEGVQTLLSFGAPVLDGWGAPGRIAHLIPGAMTRAPGGVFQSRDHHPLLIQIETRPSRTALRADQWLRIKPGTEAALALSLGHVIVAERLYSEQFIAEKAIDFSADGGPSYRRLISHFTPERTAVITGLPPDMIRETARRFAEDRPAIAIPGVDPGGGSLGYEEELAIWGLNLLVGNLGQKGGFLPRALEPAARQSDRPGGIEGLPLAPCRDVSQVPDRSIHLLIVDGPGSGCALPWAVVERKLAVGARVVNLSPFRAGSALRADLILPAPASMERLEDVPAPFDSPVSSLGLSVPILPAPAGTMEPAELV
ncbi:MAG: molybdopterin-dependent oxidoreductase, partial [Candidatus Eisenbacteria sp.]|nr:molybdopterin-dependent oxidoreductase [Candidatus Eisenbacteria bacterium]